MAGIIFTHGFDGANNNADLAAGGVTYTDGGGNITIVASDRFSTNNQKCLRLVANNSIAGRTLDAHVARIITGIACKYGNTTSPCRIAFYDAEIGGNVNQCYVSIDPINGMIGVFRNDGSQIAVSAANVISALVWFYIEIDLIINNTTGAVKVRLNGTDTVINVTGVDTQTTANAWVQGIYLQSIGGSADTYWDDWYIVDPTGASAPENDMLGNIQIFTLFPAANGTHATFTPSAGSNFQNVDDTAVDGDATYNYSSTPGNIDSFTVGSLPTTMVPIAVNVKMVAKQDNAGDHTMQNLLKSAATESLGAAVGTFQGGYRQQFDIYHVNPDTSAAWTRTSVNAIEIGYKLTS